MFLRFQERIILRFKVFEINQSNSQAESFQLKR